MRKRLEVQLGGRVNLDPSFQVWHEQFYERNLQWQRRRRTESDDKAEALHASQRECEPEPLPLQTTDLVPSWGAGAVLTCTKPAARTALPLSGRPRAAARSGAATARKPAPTTTQPLPRDWRVPLQTAR